jgi:hypothetical protein
MSRSEIGLRNGFLRIDQRTQIARKRDTFDRLSIRLFQLFQMDVISGLHHDLITGHANMCNQRSYEVIHGLIDLVERIDHNCIGPQFELVSACAIVDIFLLATVVHQRLEEKS